MNPTDADRHEWWSEIRQNLMNDYGLEDGYIMQIFKDQVFSCNEKPAYSAIVDLPWDE